MRISARNQITGTVHAIQKGDRSYMIEVAIAPGVFISAVVDDDSFEELALEVGKEVVTVVKATNVLIGVSEWHGSDRPVEGEALF